MIDEPPKTYPIRCRWCAESLVIDVPFDVRVQAGHAECSRGHVTPYRYDGVTVLTEERRAHGRMVPYDTPRRGSRKARTRDPGPTKSARIFAVPSVQLFSTTMIS